jgi:16S rRNA (cytosine967-C5)-methyltransferase
LAASHKIAPARRAAWQAVSAWLVAEARTARLGSPKRPFPPPELRPHDRALCKRIAEGSVRRRATLDAVLSELSNGRRIRPHGVHAALLLGAYELLFESRSKERAVVHDAVELARLAASEGGARFANALLRRLSRERELEQHLPRPLHDASYAEFATYWSLPEVLVARWILEHGIETAERLFAAANERPSYTLRIRPQVKEPQRLIDELREHEIETVPGPHPRTLLVVPRPGQRMELLGSAAFARGDVLVQDSASVEAVDLLDLEPGQRVLDFCAAPGGKTIAIADAMGDQGQVVAWDARRERLERLPPELERLGLQSVHVASRRAELEERAPFDRILVDAPCSNTGVLHKRAEARWHFDEDVLESICDLQRHILEDARRLLAPGGRLVYVTCSIEPEENEGLVRAWAGPLDLELVSTERSLPEPQLRDGGGVSVLLSP